MRIGIDIDSVLAEAMPIFLASIKERHGLDLKKEDITKWNMNWGEVDLYREICCVLDQPELVINMPLVDGAKEGMIYLRGRYKVKLITSRKDTRAPQTRAWADKHFGNIEIVHTDADKNGYNVDVLIDDAPHHIEAFAKKHRWAIVFDQPWNHNVDFKGLPVLRANNWEEVLLNVEIVRALYDLEALAETLKYKEEPIDTTKVV